MRLVIHDITVEEIRKIIKALGLKEDSTRFEFGVLGEAGYPELDYSSSNREEQLDLPYDEEATYPEDDTDSDEDDE
jgi:hypothetical protein